MIAFAVGPEKTIQSQPVHCAVDGCEGEAKKAGFCWAHYKRRQEGRTINEPINKITGSRTINAESVLEACLRYAEADSDDDEAWRKARRAMLYIAESYGRRAISEKIRRTLREKQERGEPVGRPKTAIDDADIELLRIGAIRVQQVAEKYAVSRVTVWKRVKKTSLP